MANVGEEEADPENDASNYERTLDIIATDGRAVSHFNSDFLYSRIQKSPGAAESPIFKMLPSHIRLEIWGNLFSIPAGKKIILSKDFVMKPVFPDNYFISPWDVIEPIQGAISSCRQMREEILWYFCHKFHFHVTFSPFTTGQIFSGLSIRWLNIYAKWINNLTLEVDFTKFGFSKAAAASSMNLVPSCSKIYKLIKDLVAALLGESKAAGGFSNSLRQDTGICIANLHLMARSFKGSREPETSTDLQPSSNPSIIGRPSSLSLPSISISKFLIDTSFRISQNDLSPFQLKISLSNSVC
jgi:hypothetical protein